MRAGVVAALLFSAAFVQARPAPEQKRDIIDSITKAADGIFTSDIAPILSAVTPEIATLFGEATSALDGLFATNTALGHEATAIASAFESKASQIEKDIASKNGAPQMRGSASLGLGLATALGTALLGAYAIL